MSIPVLILGESGAGKSASLRNLDPARCLLIQPISKPLPFRNSWKAWDSKARTGQIIVSMDWAYINRVITNAAKVGKDVVILDDFQYLMLGESMARRGEHGFTKFMDLAANVWENILGASRTGGNVRVYFLTHQDTDQYGTTKIKTIGKMLDEKVTVEGMFSIVMGARVSDGRHYFATRNSGRDTIKTPMGLFDESEIDNDLNAVDAAICEYYNLNQ